MFTRKYRSKTENLKILNYESLDSNFKVTVMGSRNKDYELNFNSDKVTCSCPDYTFREEKPICKHIYFLLYLSDIRIFNEITNLSDLSSDKISQIKENLLKVIGSKKNITTPSIIPERDDNCPICMDVLNSKIEKCSNCYHVMHIDCIKSWWGLSKQTGTCAYCRQKGMEHISNNNDPWIAFDFERLRLE